MAKTNERARSFHPRLGDILRVTAGTFAGHTGRVIQRSPVGCHLTIPGVRLPVFVAKRHLEAVND